MMGAKLLRQFRLVGALGNRRDLESHVPGILHSQMTKAADTEHSDKITGLRRCVSQGAERRQPRAQQRRRIDRQQVVRDRYEPAGLCEHRLGIATVMMNAAVFLVAALHQIAIAAELAIAAGPSKKPYTHPPTNRPPLNTGTKRIDPPDDLVTRNTRVADAREAPIHCRRIRVADATGLNPQPHLARTRFRKHSLD